MDANLIFTVALAAAIIVVVLALVGIIIYYRWQLGDKNATLGRFIDENAELNSRPRIQTTGDPMIGIRDRIVRKRRINEGHPLPPPTPVMRK